VASRRLVVGAQRVRASRCLTGVGRSAALSPLGVSTGFGVGSPGAALGVGVAVGVGGRGVHRPRVGDRGLVDVDRLVARGRGGRAGDLRVGGRHSGRRLPASRP
jgi:hypothetical protein